MKKTALIIGNSDGIGLAISKKLLQSDWNIVGVSRSGSPLECESCWHFISNVQDDTYLEILGKILAEFNTIELCIYSAGIGERLDFSNMTTEIATIEVNLLGMVKTTSVIIPYMLKNKSGHFIGLSSIADDLLSDEGPSYHASKAGFSNYLESMALALESEPIAITNLRFGFVDTKMAKGDTRPFMMSLERAVQHIEKCIEEKPIRYTAPRFIIPLVKFRKYILNLKVLMH
jgi:short-subunit dehydrogenase